MAELEKKESGHAQTPEEQPQKTESKKEMKSRREKKEDKDGDDSVRSVAHAAPSRARFNASQMKQAQKRMHAAKKAAIAKAKEEEKNYVDYRIQEILFAYRPKTAGAYRNADLAFPRRRRGVSMGFGERKAYFLAMRPNPKFATWFGKRNILGKTKKPKPSTADTGPRIMAPCAPAPVTTGKHEKKPGPGGVSVYQTVTAAGEEDDDISDRDGKKKGQNARNPLVRGVPFWTVGQEGEDEITDDDLPIDMEIIDKVCNGEKKLDPRPFEKTRWDVWDTLDAMKHYDKLFERETILFSNTVETVLNLYPDNDHKPPERAARPRIVKWGKTLNVTTFDVQNRDPGKERTPVTEPLKDIRREK